MAGGSFIVPPASSRPEAPALRALELASIVLVATLAAPAPAALAHAADEEPPIIVSDRPFAGTLYNGAKPAFVVGHGPAIILSKPAAVFTWDVIYPVDAFAVDDGSGVARVEFERNGVLVFVDEEAPFGYEWSLGTSPSGWYDFRVTAVDGAGNRAFDEVRALVVATGVENAQGPVAFVGEDPASGLSLPGE